jgi:branched-chain amino acid transport system substrate-binding protein
MSLLALPVCWGGAAEEKTIKLGIITEMTGPGAYAGKDLSEAVKLRLEEANYQVAGKRIEVIWEDDATDPVKAIEKAKKLIELDKVDLLFGPAFTDAQEAISPYLAKEKMLDITPVSGSWDMVQYGNWILIPSTAYAYATPLADFAIEQGYKTMTTICADYAFGRKVLSGVTDRFKELGGEVIQQQWTQYGTLDYAPYFTALKKGTSWCGGRY